MRACVRVHTHTHTHSHTQDMVTWLSIDIGWEAMARDTGLKCFAVTPSINSSLKVCFYVCYVFFVFSFHLLMYAMCFMFFFCIYACMLCLRYHAVAVLKSVHQLVRPRCCGERTTNGRACEWSSCTIALSAAAASVDTSRAPPRTRKLEKAGDGARGESSISGIDSQFCSEFCTYCSLKKKSTLVPTNSWF